MEPPEIIDVDEPVVRCDGGGGALGHPAVYLNMGEKTEIDCPYCGRRFVLKKGAKGVGKGNRHRGTENQKGFVLSVSVPLW